MTCVRVDWCDHTSHNRRYGTIDNYCLSNTATRTTIFVFYDLCTFVHLTYQVNYRHCASWFTTISLSSFSCFLSFSPSTLPSFYLSFQWCYLTCSRRATFPFFVVVVVIPWLCWLSSSSDFAQFLTKYLVLHSTQMRLPKRPLLFDSEHQK